MISLSRFDSLRLRAGLAAGVHSLATTMTAIRRKLVIVGDGAAGKSSLLAVFALGEFPSSYTPTVFDNYVAELRLDGKNVALALWDTAGQEEYERLRPLSYASSHVIIIAFSLDSPDSLENVQTKWGDEVRQIAGPDIPVILVGCKKDLRKTGVEFVTTEEVSPRFAFCQNSGADGIPRVRRWRS